MFGRVLNMALVFILDHLFSTYAKFSEKLTFLPPPLIPTRTCAYQGVRNVSFLENFPYLLNEWALLSKKYVFYITFSYYFSKREQIYSGALSKN